MRILLLNAHPDKANLCDSMMGAYVQGVGEAAHDLRVVALRELQFARGELSTVAAMFAPCSVNAKGA